MKTVVVNSNNKDDAYKATVLLFDAVKVMAINKIGGWQLAESFTDCDQGVFETMYSNGKMWIKAYSICGNHEYSFGEVE